MGRTPSSANTDGCWYEVPRSLRVSRVRVYVATRAADHMPVVQGGPVNSLRDAGIDPDGMREDARRLVEEATPPGWEAVMVRSPWPESECPCPACRRPITVENVSIGVLTKRLERPRTLLFVLAVVCDGCVDDSYRLSTLAILTFQ